MDAQEAKHVAEQELVTLRKRPYTELLRYLEPRFVETREVVGPSGRTYYVETVASLGPKPDGSLRVSVLVDNGGLRSFFPLSAGFTAYPEGSAAGE